MKRSKLELFICKCRPCENFRDEVELSARNHHDLQVIHALDGNDGSRVKTYGIRLLPTLVIDGSSILEGVPADGPPPGPEYIEALRRLTRPLPGRQT